MAARLPSCWYSWPAAETRTQEIGPRLWIDLLLDVGSRWSLLPGRFLGGSFPAGFLAAPLDSITWPASFSGSFRFVFGSFFLQSFVFNHFSASFLASFRFVFWPFLFVFSNFSGSFFKKRILFYFFRLSGGFLAGNCHLLTMNPAGSESVLRQTLSSCTLRSPGCLPASRDLVRLSH